MYQTLRCVVLRTIRYDDRRAIVSVWSDGAGRVSFVIPDGASREARRRRALMMPLSLVEGEADMRPGRDLHNIRDVRPLRVLSSLSADPAKSVVSLFLAEVLDRVLRDSPPDELLSMFLFDAIENLDRMPTAVGVANYPLVFLNRLGRFIGIAPDSGEWSEGKYFDLREARYRTMPPTHRNFLEPEGAAIAALLDRLDWRNSSRLRLPRQLRREMLDRMLEYYSFHHVNLSSLNSLSVVTEIF